MSDFDLGNDDVDDRDFDHEDGRNLRPDSDQFVVFSATPRIRHVRTTPWSTTLKGYELFPTRCDKISLDYSVIPGVISVLCFVFGILYCFFGKFCPSLLSALRLKLVLEKCCWLKSRACIAIFHLLIIIDKIVLIDASRKASFFKAVKNFKLQDIVTSRQQCL